VAAPAEHSESEILLDALELVLCLVAHMERCNPAEVDRYLDLLDAVSRGTERSA
jgi:hypothetical protein